MKIVALHFLRWMDVVAAFVLPMLVGLCFVAVTFWFATWWPPLLGLEDTAFFLAAFFTSWGLLPYFWVVEFAAVVKHMDKALGATQWMIEQALAKRGVYLP